jgi:hypothetical protein
MVKIDPFYALKKKFENHQHFFQPLLDEDYQKEGDPLILLQFENQLLKSEIAFYPNSGSDIADLVFFKKYQHPTLTDVKPTLFIHSDYMCNALYSEELDNKLIQNSFSINAKFYYRGQADQNGINIYKLKFKDEKQTLWLAFLGGYYYEEVIDFIVKQNIKTKIIYFNRDGITHDMGVGRTDIIPIILLLFLSNKLGIKFIITEQDPNWISNVVSERNVMFWLLRAKGRGENEIIDALLGIKDPPKLKNKIIEALTKFEEYPIEEIEYPKLVIKKIS